MEIVRKFTKMLETRLHEELNFVQVVLGPRQVVKTTGLEQIIRRWKGPVKMVSADEVYYWRNGCDEVDFVVKMSGRTYAVEVKSGRIRRTNGLAKFIRRYSGCIPVIIDQKRGTRLLEGATFEEVLLI